MIKLYGPFYKSIIKGFTCILLLLPVIAIAQQTTTVQGVVLDGETGQPLQSINVRLEHSTHGTSTDSDGKFSLIAPGLYSQVTFSETGYTPLTRKIDPGKTNELTIRLYASKTTLKEVTVRSPSRKRYRNKDNPAVELIRQVIAHKDQNRMQSADYLQYDQYERFGLSVFDLSDKFINGHFFSKYKFMLDSTTVINGQKKVSLPIFFDEKLSKHYYRKNPEKTVDIHLAKKEVNIIRFLDTASIDIYMNRLYGNNIDIYENNIFILVNQFLSPIANHSPDYYKFFITDTLQTPDGKLVELNFTPRNKGDLLFEGKILVTLDGNYAVKACELNINKQINLNFLRGLKVRLDFTKQPGGRYYLTRSDASADFGFLPNKGFGVTGQRIVNYTGYRLNSPMPEDFYKGKSIIIAKDSSKDDPNYFNRHRTDTLTPQQAQVYAKVNRLQNMRSFKTTMWIATSLVGGYADLGPVQIGHIGSFFAFNNQEGARLEFGGRTTPKFNKTIYLDGYTAYGTHDQQVKYNLNTYLSLNKTAFYRFPNDYFKFTYLYDVNLPGQGFTADNNNIQALTSLHTGKTDYWLYSRIISATYVKDFENHLTYRLGLRSWRQQPAGTLAFIQNDAEGTPVHDLTTTEAELDLRYVPHEQILQGTRFRRTVHSKYPILSMQLQHGFSGFLGGSYNYNRISANIYKRVYLSQLGYGDMTILGNVVTGKIPFPLLNISQANQSLAFDPDAYNKMYYLEFVSDHYVGFNYTQSFNGFFLNKIPLIERLKWREYLSFKILYGGLRDENNPQITPGLYRLPPAANGAYGTYALGNTPYIEAGAGIGNIFKIFEVDLIRRFNYLDHPGVSEYGIKFTISPDL